VVCDVKFEKKSKFFIWCMLFCSKFLVYLGDILGIYLGHISWVYLGHIFGISRAYLGHISGISWAYLHQLLWVTTLPILGISLAYLGHISGISWAYLHQLLWDVLGHNLALPCHVLLTSRVGRVVTQHLDDLPNPKTSKSFTEVFLKYMFL